MKKSLLFLLTILLSLVVVTAVLAQGNDPGPARCTKEEWARVESDCQSRGQVLTKCWITQEGKPSSRTVNYQCVKVVDDDNNNPKPDAKPKAKKEEPYVVPIPFVQAVDCPCGDELTWEQVLTPPLNVVHEVYSLSNKLKFVWNNGIYDDPDMHRIQVHYFVFDDRNGKVKLVCGDTIVEPIKLPVAPNSSFLFDDNNGGGCYPIVWEGEQKPPESEMMKYVLSANGMRIKKIFSCQGDPRTKK